MKVWQSYGSEHSMDLVLIGTFESVTDADLAVERIKTLTELAEREWADDSWERQDERMPDTLAEALREMNLWEMGRSDVDIYAYEHSVDRNGETVRIWTDETEPQGFIKLFLHLGARVEIFSRHNWLEDGTPRSAETG